MTPSRISVERHKVSERRACQALVQHRSTQRYVAVPGDFELRLVEVDERAGRAVAALWLPEDPRPARRGGLGGEPQTDRTAVAARRPPGAAGKGARTAGKKRSGGSENSSGNLPAIRPNHVWSYDFISGTNRRRRPDADPQHRRRVHPRMRRLSRRTQHRRPRRVDACSSRCSRNAASPRSCDPTTAASSSPANCVDWLKEHGVTAAFVAKGSPQQNAFVERFNGTMRDELLNGELFHSVTEARVVIGEWVDVYNNDASPPRPRHEDTRRVRQRATPTLNQMRGR